MYPRIHESIPGFRRLFGVVIITGLFFSISSCQVGVPAVPTETVTAVVEPTQTEPSPSATPAEPTSTPEPAAIVVNGYIVTMAEFQAELERYAAAGFELDESGMQQAVDEFINQTLLAEAAFSQGFDLNEDELEQRLLQLQTEVGGEQALANWMDQYGYTGAAFRRALKQAAAAAWMRDQIAAMVPETAEQVHARQIMLFDRTQAEQVLAQIRAGADFENLAGRYDPVMWGDLGWFTEGYLPVSAVAEASFALQPGQYSEVIETEIGFHIIQVIERDPNRILEQDALLALQVKAVNDWLEERRNQADIELFLP
jgi:peptidyl-prolyl cis-trans isomerase C